MIFLLPSALSSPFPSPAWCNSIMALGYQRPLQPTDLYQMDASRQSSLLSSNLDASWARRQTEATAYNADLLSGHIPVPFSLRIKWAMGRGGPGTKEEKERNWRTIDGRKEPSLGWAIVEQFRLFYGLAVVFKIFGDTCQLMVSSRSEADGRAAEPFVQELLSTRSLGIGRRRSA